MFQQMTRAGNRLRLALDGPAGSGKTYTALRFAFAIAKRTGGAVGVIDTERGSAKKYIGETVDGVTWQWQGVELQHFAPSTYKSAIEAAAREGIGILVIDSLSHAWSGTGGALDQVDRIAGRSDHRGGSFAAWRDVTPQHNAMVDAILDYPGHVIATLRTKIEYSVEKDERGKTRVEKVGTKPVQREGVDYEFDLVCDLDQDHRMTISKTRCSAVDGDVVAKPDGAWVSKVLDWLEGIEPEPVFQASWNEPLPAEKVAAIKAAALESGTSPDALRAVLGRLGVSSLAELSVDQAGELLARLRRSKNGSKPAEDPIVAGALYDPEAVGPDAARANEIKHLWKRLGWDVEKLRAFLASKGVSAVADLPRSTATELHRRLSEAQFKQEADKAF